MAYGARLRWAPSRGLPGRAILRSGVGWATDRCRERSGGSMDADVRQWNGVTQGVSWLLAGILTLITVASGAGQDDAPTAPLALALVRDMHDRGLTTLRLRISKVPDATLASVDWERTSCRWSATTSTFRWRWTSDWHTAITKACIGHSPPRPDGRSGSSCTTSAALDCAPRGSRDMRLTRSNNRERTCR